MGVTVCLLICVSCFASGLRRRLTIRRGLGGAAVLPPVGHVGHRDGGANAALALVIAGTVLGDDAMAIPGAVYGVLMYGSGLLFALTMRRCARDHALDAAPAAHAA